MSLSWAMTRNDEKVVTGWGDGSIRCFDMSSPKGEIWSISNAQLTPVTVLSIAKSGNFLLSGAEDGAVCVWDIRCREMVVQMKQHGSTITGIAITEDDSVAVTSSKDKNFMSWDLHSHRRITCHTQRMGAINGVILAKDQVQVVTVGNDCKLSFWDLREPQPLQVGSGDAWASAESFCRAAPPGPSALWPGVAGRPCCMAMTSRLWRMGRWRKMHEDAHDQPSSCIAMSIDGSLVASGGNDNAVRLWDFNSTSLPTAPSTAAGSRRFPSPPTIRASPARTATAVS